MVNIENQVKTVRRPNLILNVFYGQPSHYSLEQEVFFNITATQGPLPQGIFKLRLIARNIVDGNYDIWLPTIEEVGEETFFS
ncbi:MAG TPA: hypothetical protein DDW34_05920, partial [Clostridium sp.]|nr:hypothetical protein [Clostridium sp.]